MALTTPTSAKAWSPDIYTFAPEDVIPDALILNASTVAGVIEGDEPAVRVAYVDDGDLPAFVAEGGDIDEDDPTLAEVLVHTGAIKKLVKVSNEQFLQLDTGERLSNAVQRVVTKACDKAFLTQAAPSSPAVTPPAGLLHVADLTAGDEVVDNLDPLVDLIAALQANDSTPTAIILDPLGWAALRKIKLGDSYNASLLGAGTTDSPRMLLDLPVIVNNYMTAYTGLVIDQAAVVSAVGQVKVAQSSDFYFGSDSVALRCTFRFGQNVVHPERVGTFTIDDGDESDSMLAWMHEPDVPTPAPRARKSSAKPKPVVADADES